MVKLEQIKNFRLLKKPNNKHGEIISELRKLLEAFKLEHQLHLRGHGNHMIFHQNITNHLESINNNEN